MTYRTFKRLVEPMQAHGVLTRLWQEVKPYVMAGHALEVIVKPETRSTAQNSRMWAMLNEVSRQVPWHGQTLTAEEWKDVFTAALKRQKVVPGLDGGFVVLGQRTSAMSKQELSELMDLIEVFGVQHGVEFRELIAA